MKVKNRVSKIDQADSQRGLWDSVFKKAFKQYGNRAQAERIASAVTVDLAAGQKLGLIQGRNAPRIKKRAA